MTARRRVTLASQAPRLRTLSTVTAAPAAKRADSIYRTAEWRALIAELLRTRGRRCEAKGCGRSGTRIYGDHVHELQDGGAPFDPANIRLLCGSCHTTKTAAARATRMRAQHG